MVQGNAYDLNTSLTNLELPNTLEKSTAAFKNSLVIGELFGKAWVDHFTVTREWEAKCYKDQKKDDPDWHWMRDRYFEII